MGYLKRSESTDRSAGRIPGVRSVLLRVTRQNWAGIGGALQSFKGSRGILNGDSDALGAKSHFKGGITRVSAGAAIGLDTHQAYRDHQRMTG